MNILFVTPFFPPDKTVATVRMASLVRYILQNTRHKVFVLTNKKRNIVEIPAVYYFVDPDVSGGYFERFKHNEIQYNKAISMVLAENKIDCIIISGGPFYTFRLTSYIKRKGIPCILDFRDPWVFDTRELKEVTSLKNIVGKIREIPRERQSIKNADRVVTVTSNWLKLFKYAYPLSMRKFDLISNGYDDVLLKNINKLSRKRDGKLEIGVFGKLFYYTEKYSNLFIEALKSCSELITILQVGDRENITQELLEKNGLDSNLIRSTGFIDYADGISLLLGSDVFLIIDGRKDAIGTKIYDYIYMKKPIIFVGPANTELYKMVSELPNGYSCSTEIEIINAFNKLILQKKNGKMQISDCSEMYARSLQNEKWLNLIENVVRKKMQERIS